MIRKATSSVILLFILLNSFAQEAKPHVNLGHKKNISCIDLSDDGKLIVSGGSDNSIILWNKRGQELRRFNNIFRRAIIDVEISPDNNYLLATTGFHIGVWNLYDGKLASFYDMEEGRITSILFDRSSYQVSKPIVIAAVSDITKRSIIKWDAKSREIIDKIDRKKALSPDHILYNPYKGYYYSLNEKSLMKINGDDWKTNFVSKHKGFYKAAFDGDFERLALLTAEDSRNIQIVDRVSFAVRGTLSARSTQFIDFKFSPDNKYFLATTDNNKILVWDAQHFKLVKEISCSNGESAEIEISNDSKFIYSAEGANIIAYHISTGRKINEFSGKVYAVTSVGFSPVNRKDKKGGKFIFTGGRDALKIWNTSNLIDIKTYESNSVMGVNAMFNTDGSRILFADDKGIDEWNILTDKRINHFPEPERNSFESIVQSVVSGFVGSKKPAVYSNNSKLIASSSQNRITVFKSVDGTILHDFLDFNQSVMSLAFSPNDKYLAAGGGDRDIIIYNTEKGSKVKVLKGHRSDIRDIIFSPKSKDDPDGGKYLLSCSSDKTIILWDVNSGQKLKTYTTGKKAALSLDFNSDGTEFISAGYDNQVTLWDTKSTMPTKIFKGHDNWVLDIEFSPDNKSIISGSEDGTCKLWDVETGRLKVTIVGLRNSDDYIAYTPDGYFTCTKKGAESIHLVKGLDAYSLKQFNLQYNRPDIVLKEFGFVSEKEILAYKKAYEKRLSKMGIDESVFGSETHFNLPNVVLNDNIDLYQETDEREFTFSYTASDNFNKIERLKLSINNVPIFGKEGQKITETQSSDADKTLTVLLENGLNTFELSVLNEKSVESLSQKFDVYYTPKTNTKPNLHLVVIGVSNFIKSEYNLKYAEKDASDLINLVQGKEEMFNKRFVHSFIDKDATTDKILKVRSMLGKTSVDDYVIVFIASHGLLDENLDYYIATHDVDFSNPKNKGLAYSELESLLDNIPSRNRLMFIDACHSGEVDKDEIAIAEIQQNSNDNVNARGFKSVSTNNLGLRSSFDLMKDLFNDLRENNGVMVIASASGKEFAFESDEWKNGVFTFALLEGLKTYNADLDGDRSISVNELNKYVGKKVKELTNGKQNPTSRTDIDNDMIIW